MFLILFWIVLIWFVVAANPAQAYVQPVERPVVDVFDLPDNPYAAGNRGVDYDTEPGDTVKAAGEGVVTFAGQVGGALHVVVKHGDGLRTTYGYLQSIGVVVGRRIEEGEVIGTAGSSLHFGLRRGSQYLDPLGLFEGAHLVPVDDVDSFAGRPGGHVGTEAMSWLTSEPHSVSDADTAQSQPAQPLATSGHEGTNVTPIALIATATSGLAAHLLRRRSSDPVQSG